MNFCGIQRDVDEVLISCIFFLRFLPDAVFAVPSGARRQVLSEAVEYMWGWVPGRDEVRASIAKR